MCLYLPIDKVSFPNIYDIEGITTMPVCLAVRSRNEHTIDLPRYLVAAVPPVSNAETPFG
jgi:hypothetical protein